jgi:branched-chain amino acid transport system permease protein
MTFFLNYLIQAEIFSVMALSTNLLVGIIGIFSVSQAAIFGVGAYAVALLLLGKVASFPAAMLIAVLLCAILNIVLALPSLRVTGDYFVVTSFGCQLVATAIFINWSQLTGGASGLVGIPTPSVLGYSTEEPQAFACVSTLVLAISCLGFWLLMRSPFGRIVNAIRQDELAVAAAGRDVLRAKVSVAAVSGAFAGMAGGLYATYLSFIDPTSFDISVSIVILTMLVVGGARTLAGSLVGPFLLLALPHGLDLIELSPTIVGPMRQLIYGALLIVFMMFRPQGIAGRRL